MCWFYFPLSLSFFIPVAIGARFSDYRRKTGPRKYNACRRTPLEHYIIIVRGFFIFFPLFILRRAFARTPTGNVIARKSGAWPTAGARAVETRTCASSPTFALSPAATIRTRILLFVQWWIANALAKYYYKLMSVRQMCEKKINNNNKRLVFFTICYRYRFVRLPPFFFFYRRVRARRYANSLDI